MRWSQWRAHPPVRDATSPRVCAAVDAVLRTLGAPSDGDCWVGWGDDAMIRWSMLMPSTAGLIVLAVRPAGGSEGPRVAGKLVRWGRVQIGEFAVDYQAGHRVLGVSVEGIVLRGADADADAIGAFLQVVYAAIDGRSAAPVAAPTRGIRAKGSSKAPVVDPPAEPIAAPPAPEHDEDDEELPIFVHHEGGAPALPSGLATAARPAAASSPLPGTAQPGARPATATRPPAPSAQPRTAPSSAPGSPAGAARPGNPAAPGAAPARPATTPASTPAAPTGPLHRRLADGPVPGGSSGPGGRPPGSSGRGS